MDAQETWGRTADEREKGTRFEEATGGRREGSAKKGRKGASRKGKFSQVDRKEKAAGTGQKSDAREWVRIAEAFEGDWR